MRQAIVRARYPTRQDVLASYRTSREALTLFVPTDEAIETGTHVRLIVTFGDAQEIFELEGRVAWRVEPRRGGQAPGLAVAFLAPERYRVARMLAFCGGRPMTAVSHVADRVPAQFPVVVRLGQSKLSGFVRDVSASGVFVAGDELGQVNRGCEVVIQLSRGWLGLGAKRVKAAVVWRGVKYGVRGFGARFVEAPERTGPVLRRYLARPR
ncbi:MAG TPA: PilZ domain-containing protein [Myxococcales bacterium]|jgi:Tfp pilus assembly protein PilZ